MPWHVPAFITDGYESHAMEWPCKTDKMYCTVVLHYQSNLNLCQLQFLSFYCLLFTFFYFGLWTFNYICLSRILKNESQ